MRERGISVAEIFIWIAAAGVGIIAALADGVTSRISLVTITGVLSLVPVVIEAFRRRRFKNSAPAEAARKLADEAWNSIIILRGSPSKHPDSAANSHDNPGETPDQTMPPHED
jgi:hypothetical protein